MNNQAGKGDKPRPVNKKVYNENFDTIFTKKTASNSTEVKKSAKLGKTTYKY
jgi:hypothetical protein